ncbi:MAG: hypothetical protein LUG51_13095 [Tannerellaceae bacterium]|nr:hypothetical protein [Tannerellaceae bacterium]
MKNKQNEVFSSYQHIKGFINVPRELLAMIFSAEEQERPRQIAFFI